MIICRNCSQTFIGKLWLDSDDVTLDERKEIESVDDCPKCVQDTEKSKGE